MPKLVWYPNGGGAQIDGSDLKAYRERARAEAIVALNHDAPEDSAMQEANGKQGTGKRGLVKGMSKRARNNFLVEIAQLDLDAISQSAVALSLTYPDKFPCDSGVWIKDRNALAQWLRDNFPGFGAIWVMDFKTRKSGTSKGQVAPHLHIVMYLPNVRPDKLDQWVKDNIGRIAKYWHKRVGNKDENHLKNGVNIKILKTREDVEYFLRYIAKLNSLWVAAHYPNGTGCTWNMWYEENLPKSPMIELDLTEEQFYAVERYFKARIWKEVKEDRHFSSLRSFVEDDFPSFLMSLGIPIYELIAAQ